MLRVKDQYKVSNEQDFFKKKLIFDKGCLICNTYKYLKWKKCHLFIIKWTHEKVRNRENLWRVGLYASTYGNVTYTTDAVKFDDQVHFGNTDGPRYMREIGTPKIGSNITNLHIKRPRITVNLRIGSRKKDHFWITYTKNRR